MNDAGRELAKSLGISIGKEGVIKDPSQEMIAIARANFRQLTMVNPNFFGTSKKSAYEPVMLLEANTFYEELVCVGFNPQFDRLEAIAHIHQELGYSGGVCFGGSPEYVRFYLSFDDGASWQDQGMASFTAYDIMGDKPLEYAATLQISPEKEECSVENLPLVRAILEWRSPPPPETPDHPPIWGNVVEERIQIGKLVDGDLAMFLEKAKIEIPESLKKILDLKQPLKQVEPEVLSMAQLHELYADSDVPQHRYLYPGLQKLLSQPSLLKSSYEAVLSELEVDTETVLQKVLTIDGDISYEELKCVGLNPNDDTLVATLTIKRPTGYLGEPCSAGSREYVAFWERDEIEMEWIYLGTASVVVHNFSTIPDEGLQYSVFLPVDFARHHRPCIEGPRTIRIRAILSWVDEPPPDDPRWLPPWGNREETCVHVAPGRVERDDHSPYIETVGSMSVDDIDDLTGLATGHSDSTADFEAQDSPFGGIIWITGRLLNPTDSYGGVELPLRYMVSVRSDPAEPWQPLTNSFGIRYVTLNGAVYNGPFDHNMEVVDGLWYEYIEDRTGDDRKYPTIPKLAKWVTGGDMKGVWEIRIDAHDPNTGIAFPGSQIVRVDLDQKAPSVETFTITGFSRGGGPEEPALPCGKFQVGDVIHGEYDVRDEDGHFRALTLGVRPGGAGWPSFGASPDPSIRWYYSLGATDDGDSGTWTLDTAGMAPCGFVVHLWTGDRTIVDGRRIGWENGDDVGFCLEEAP